MADQLVTSPPDTQDQSSGNPVTSAQALVDNGKALALAHAAFQASTGYFDNAVRKQVLDNLRQFQGLHPQGSKYLSDAYRARSKFFRPKTRAAVRKNEATAAEAFFATQDVVSVAAHDDDDKLQQASAEILKELLTYRLRHSIPWFQTCIGAYQDAMVQGIVCSYQYWEVNERKKIDRPTIKLRPVENIRFDPSADWTDPVTSSPYFIDMLPMYVKDVKARMRTIDHKLGERAWMPADDGVILQAATQFNDVVRMQREGNRQDPRAQPAPVSDYAVVWVHRNILDLDGGDYVFYTLGTQHLLSTPIPLEQAYFHGRRPYVIGNCVIETHKSFPSAPVHLTKDIQAELNENANQRSDNVKFAMNKRYFAKRTAMVDLRSLQRNVPSSVTLMNDPETDVKVVETKDVTRSAYEEQDRLNLDFDDLAGSFSQASVQANRKLNETVGGMNILTKDASQITAYQLRTFTETWVEPVLDQLVLLEQRYESDDVILGLAGKRADLFQKFGVATIDANLLMQMLTVDVNVGVGATNPHDQLTNFMLGMNSLKELLADGTLLSYGLAVGEITKEIFGKLGYKDGARFFPTEIDPQVQALMGQVKQLQQALEAKHPPELIAAQVREIDARIKDLTAKSVKTGVEAMYSATQGAEVLSAVPQAAPVADSILQAAGYTPPQPAGVDPNLLPGASSAGLAVEPVKNKRTGVSFQPGGGDPTAPVGGAGNTNPSLPKPPAAPASPGQGAARGIETQRADGT